MKREVRAQFVSWNCAVEKRGVFVDTKEILELCLASRKGGKNVVFLERFLSSLLSL